MIYIHVDVGCYSVVTDSLPTMLIGWGLVDVVVSRPLGMWCKWWSKCSIWSVIPPSMMYTYFCSFFPWYVQCYRLCFLATFLSSDINSSASDRLRFWHERSETPIFTIT
jgi:hypothetical protein